MQKNKTLSKTEKFEEFEKAWKREFSLDLLSDKGVHTLLRLKEEYDLSYDNITELTGIKKSSLQYRATKKQGPKQKPGPKPKLNEIQAPLVIKELTEKRKNKEIVNIEDVQRVADIIVGFPTSDEKNRSHYISPSTASRLLKNNDWKYKRTHNRVPQSDCMLRDLYINNFKTKVRFIIDMLDLSKDQLYTMDESGIHTNLSRKYTFTYKGDKNVYVKSSSDTTKDTVMVTLSASGGGFLYYVPYSPKTSTHKAVKGVGNEQMKEWARAFIGRTKNQTGLLIIDNLNSHKNEDILEYLLDHNIFVLPIPVRCADELSVLDNSFFSAYKVNLSLLFAELADKKGEELRQKKKDIIFEEFKEMIKEGNIQNYYSEIGYSKMFSEQEQIIKETFIPNSDSDKCINTYEVSEKKYNDKEYSPLIADMVQERLRYDIIDIKCKNYEQYSGFIAMLYAIYIIPHFKQIWNTDKDDPSGVYSILKDMDAQKSNPLMIDNHIKNIYGESILKHSDDLIDVTDFLFNIMNINFDVDIIETKQGLSTIIGSKSMQYLVINQEKDLMKAISCFMHSPPNEDNKIKYRFSAPPEILMIFINRIDKSCIQIPENLDLSEFCTRSKEMNYNICATFAVKEKEKLAFIKNKEQWVKWKKSIYKSSLIEALVSYCGDTGEGYTEAVLYIRTTKSIVDETTVEETQIPIKCKETQIPTKCKEILIPTNYKEILIPKKYKEENQSINQRKEQGNYNCFNKFNTIINSIIKKNTFDVNATVPIAIKKVKNENCRQIKGEKTSGVGIPNLGATCYISVVLQIIFKIPELQNIIIDINEKGETNSMNKELCKIIKQFNDAKVKTINIRNFCVQNNIDPQKAASVEIFYNNIMESLAAYDSRIEDLFRIRREGISYIINEFFIDTMIFKKEAVSLDDLIKEVINPDAKTVHMLPKYLTIEIGRSEDSDHTPVKVPQVLDMDKYVNKNIYNGKTTYRLFSVVGRLFDTKAGLEHYIVFMQDEDNKWVLYNDRYITYCDENDVITTFNGGKPVDIDEGLFMYKQIVVNFLVYIQIC